jgi:hypothetical protein
VRKKYNPKPVLLHLAVAPKQSSDVIKLHRMPIAALNEFANKP